MAKHRYLFNELITKGHKDYLSDNKMVRAILADRMGDCSNIYTPLYRRLQELYNKYDKLVNQEEDEQSRTEVYIPNK